MLIFEFLEKDLGIVSLQRFIFDFSRKIFLLYSINEMALLDCFYFLRCWAIPVLQLFVSQVVKS